MLIENINDLKLRQLQPKPFHVASNQKTVNQPQSTFEQLLQEKLQGKESLQFSKHSKERIVQRGIEMTEELLGRMNEAATSAKQKGAKDVVMIDKEAVFIVSIPNNTVITAMNGNEMKQNIFTKIDGAVLI